MVPEERVQKAQPVQVLPCAAASGKEENGKTDRKIQLMEVRIWQRVSWKVCSSI